MDFKNNFENPIFKFLTFFDNIINNNYKEILYIIFVLAICYYNIF